MGTVYGELAGKAAEGIFKGVPQLVLTLFVVAALGVAGAGLAFWLGVQHGRSLERGEAACRGKGGTLVGGSCVRALP